MTTTTQSQTRVLDFPTFTPKQEEVWDYICDGDDGDVSVVGWGGSYGGGKTSGLVRIALMYAVMYPGSNIIIGRDAQTALKAPGSTMKQFLDILPMNGEFVKNGGIVKRRSETNFPLVEIQMPDWPKHLFSTVYFRQLSDFSFLKSAEFTAILGEEADSFTEDSWKYAISRLRQRLPDGSVPKYLALAVFNPSISWPKEWFIDDIAQKQEEYKDAGRVHFFQAKQEDNPYLPENYEQILRATFDDDEIAANVDGLFSSIRGTIFSNFSPATHAIPQTTRKVDGVEQQGMDAWPAYTTKTIVLNGQRLVIPKFKWAVGGLDFAGTQKKAHLSTGTVSVVTEQGRDYLIDCFADNGPGVHTRQKDWMHMMERTLGMPIEWTADGTQSVAISYLTNDGFSVKKNLGSNDAWVQAIHYIRGRFQLDKSGYAQSYYMLTERNKGWAREIQQYRVDMKQGPNGVWKDKPIEKDDDRYDAYRYQQERLMLMTKTINPNKRVPDPGGRPDKKKASLFTEFDAFALEKMERQRRERAYQIAQIARQENGVPA